MVDHPPASAATGTDIGVTAPTSMTPSPPPYGRRPDSLRECFNRVRMMRARFDDDGSDVTPDWVPDPMVESPEPVVTASPRRRATVPVPSLWTPLPFGRHGGKTLPQLIFADPDYFFWGWENDAFACRGFDVEEVERIHRRATAIRPPYIDGKSQFIEHLTDDDGVFAGIQLAPAGATSGDSTLDMSFPRSCKHYDKTGNRLLVRDMKAIWFGDPSYRMNKARCEEFFNDESWFANP